MQLLAQDGGSDRGWTSVLPPLAAITMALISCEVT